jgi:hypothetical protein
MKVHELIERLATYDPNARVVVTGYEDGYDDIDEITLITVTPVIDAKVWEGAFEDGDGEAAIHLKRAPPDETRRQGK